MNHRSLGLPWICFLCLLFFRTKLFDSRKCPPICVIFFLTMQTIWKSWKFWLNAHQAWKTCFQEENLQFNKGSKPLRQNGHTSCNTLKYKIGETSLSRNNWHVGISVGHYLLFFMHWTWGCKVNFFATSKHLFYLIPSSTLPMPLSSSSNL